jgi:hypothetical protein
MSSHCASQPEVAAKQQSGVRMNFFERYLTLWVFL